MDDSSSYELLLDERAIETKLSHRGCSLLRRYSTLLAITSVFLAITNVATLLLFFDSRAAPGAPELAIPRDLETRRWEARYDHPSKYSGPPSPDVDAAWDEIIKIGPMSVSEETIRALNAPIGAVRLPTESGGGFMVLPEFVHQIHCLNLLWRSTYPQYYKRDFNRSLFHPEAFHEHADHCAESLRQKLMCDADTSLVTYAWVKGKRTPKPNMNVEHRCRKWDDVLQWALARQAPAPQGGEVVRHGEWQDFEQPPHDPQGA